jgi:uncharacterized protein (TIGR02099 family)
MIRVLKTLTAKIWLLVLLLVVATGITVALGRILVPLVSTYQEDIESWATQTLGQPVEIGFVEGHWRGLGPELILHNVSLLDPHTQRPAFKLSEIRIGLSIIDSLRNATLSPRRISLINPKLLIKRRSDGTFIVAGLESLEQDDTGGDTGVFMLPAHVVIRNAEIQWENLAIGAPPLRFTNVNARLRNHASRHQLDASLTLPGTESSLEIAADIQGNLESPGAWSGQIHFKGSKLLLSQLLHARIPAEYALTRGNSDLELWSSWENGRLNHLQGELQINQLSLEHSGMGADLKRRLELNRLGGNFRWQRRELGWELQVVDFDYQPLSGAWPKGRFSLQTEYDPNGDIRLDAGIDYVKIEDLLAAITLFPLPNPELEQTLATLAPRSEIHNLKLRYLGIPDAPEWSAAGEFRDLQLNPWRDIPGIRNLSARFWTNQQGGTLQLESKNTRVEFPGLFRDPIVADELAGQVQWSRLEEGGWRLESPSLSAKNREITTRTRLLLEIPASEEAPVTMDLQSDFRDGDSSAASRYYPVGIMPKDVVTWLDRGIGKGRITSGSCIVRGPLRDFPFHETYTGRFEVLFNVEDMELDYWPQWPDLDKLNAQVRFLNNSLDVWVRDGQIMESRIEQAHGRIRNLWPTTPFELKGEVSGPFNDTLTLLSDSPLSEQFGSMVKGMRGEGPSKLELDFAVPIEKGKFRLDGMLHFRDSTLHLDDWQLPLTSIEGSLGFNQDQVFGTQIRGLAEGHPIRVDVSTLGRETQATRILATGPIPSDALQKRFPGMGLERLEGTTDWTLLIDIPHNGNGAETPVPLAVSSNLAGVSVDLPPPLGKEADISRPLSLNTHFGKSANTPLSLKYGELLSTKLVLDTRDPASPTVLKGDILLGGGTNRLADKPGLQLRGGWKELDTGTWLELLQERPEKERPSLLNSIDLKFDRLKLGDFDLTNSQINMLRQNHAWHGKVDSQQLKGSINIPADLETQPIRVDLDNFELTIDPDALSASIDHARPIQIDPTDLPAVEANISDLRVNGKTMGSLQLMSRKIGNGLELSTLRMDSKKAQFNARGRWIKEGQFESATHISAELNTKKLGNLLHSLGFAKNIDDAPAEFDGRLSWKGAPFQFNRESLNGRLSMQIGRGRFLSVNPGVGRIFSLLNISALHRRLILDFSDTFKKGFTFDSIEGDFLLDSGDAYTENFRMKGSSAQIEIAGRIGLANEDFDQLITVTPMISSSLPLAGALASGPAVGAVLFLAQKLVGEQIDSATKREYIVTGPWDEPTVTQRNEEHVTDSREQLLSPDLLAPPGQEEAETSKWEIPSPYGKQRFSLTEDGPPSNWPGAQEFTTDLETGAVDEPTSAPDSAEKKGVFSRIFKPAPEATGKAGIKPTPENQ